MNLRILLFVLLVAPIASFSQGKELFGRILDAENEKPISGVNVIALGTTQGATTNQLGYFRFTIPVVENTLIISFIGYQTTRIDIPPSNRILFRMQKTYEMLPIVNINYINVKNLPLMVDCLRLVEGEGATVVEKNAEYPGGLTYFYNDLSRILKVDSNRILLPDSIYYLKFCVEPNGTTTFKQLIPSIVQIESSLKNSSNMFSKWCSGLQRGLSVSQCFEIPIIDKEQEFFEAEEPAEPIGGITAFEKFVKKTLVYPKEAMSRGVEGKVFIWVTIDENGRVLDPLVIKGIGGGCDEEAMNIVKRYPKWVPGRHSGKVVKQKCTVSITFKL